MTRKVKVVEELYIQPASEFILVKVDPEDDEQTAGGIIIPVGALANKKTITGTISAVGPGRRDPQDIKRRIPIDCEVDERIIFAAFIGYPLVIKGEEHVIIKHNDIMGRVDEKFHYVEGPEAESVETDAKVY